VGAGVPSELVKVYGLFDPCRRAALGSGSRRVRRGAGPAQKPTRRTRTAQPSRLAEAASGRPAVGEKRGVISIRQMTRRRRPLPISQTRQYQTQLSSPSGAAGEGGQGPRRPTPAPLLLMARGFERLEGLGRGAATMGRVATTRGVNAMPEPR